MPWRVTIAAALCGLGLHTLAARARGGDPVQGNAALASDLARELRPDDAVICTSLTRAPLEFALRSRARPETFVSFPVHAGVHLGNFDPRPMLADPELQAREAAATLRRALGRAGPDGKVFVVRASEQVNDIFAPDVFARFGIEPVLTLTGYVQTGLGQTATLEVYEAEKLRGR